MPAISQSRLWEVYDQNLALAEKVLMGLKISSGRKPAFPGLTGWIFEQTVQYCLRRELKGRGLALPIQEQARIGKRGKADIRLGPVAVEIKLSGIFSQDAIQRYAQYAEQARTQGMHYLYITGGESYRQYRDGIASAFGRENAFFLDTRGEWTRFVRRLLLLLKANASHHSRKAKRR